MKKLDTSIKKNGFIYEQVIRNDNIALYSQRDADGVLHGHELFIIKTKEAENVFGNEYPKREIFPSNNDFGVTAWSVGKDVSNALDRFSKLVKDTAQD